MGIDASVRFKARFGQSKALSFEFDNRLKSLPADTAKTMLEELLSVAIAASSTIKGVTFIEGHSESDFEDEFQVFYLAEAGRTVKYEEINFDEDESYDDDGNLAPPRVPEWYTPPAPAPSEVTPPDAYAFHVLDRDYDFRLEAIRFSEPELLQVSEILLKQFHADYVRYSETHVLGSEGSVAIATLPASTQEEFGVTFEVINLSHTLFSWDAEAKSFSMHPELAAVFSSVRDAVASYNRGGWVMYRTNEGVFLQAPWRESSRYTPEYQKYEAFIRLGHTPIEAKVSKKNPIFERAQERFSEDAFRYLDEGREAVWGKKYNDEAGRFIIMKKLVLKADGQHHLHRFKVSDFFPLVSLTKTL